MISTSTFTLFVLLLFFTILWTGYNIFIRSTDPRKSHLMGGCIINIPNNLQRFFPFINREGNIENETCLDKWALGHFCLYLIIGILVPHKYGIVILMSILCELFEYFAKCRSKLSDLLVNFLGYLLGSFLFRFHTIKLEYEPTNKRIVMVSALFLVLLLAIAGHRMYILKNIKGISTKEEFTSQKKK